MPSGAITIEDKFIVKIAATFFSFDEENLTMVTGLIYSPEKQYMIPERTLKQNQDHIECLESMIQEYSQHSFDGNLFSFLCSGVFLNEDASEYTISYRIDVDFDKNSDKLKWLTAEELVEVFEKNEETNKEQNRIIESCINNAYEENHLKSRRAKRSF